MNKIIEITDHNFDDFIQSSLKPVLVEFFAPWCGHCNNQYPVMKELADISDKYIISTINIDNNPDKTFEYSITGVPAFLVFKDGKIVDHKSGTHRLEELKKMIEQYV